MPLWFGGKGGTQVQAEQTLLHQDERHGLHRAHDQEDDRQVGGYVHGEQDSVSGPVLPGPARQSPDAGHVDAERLAYQHREEQKCLLPANNPEYSAAETCLASRHRQGAHHDVRVSTSGIRVRVVTVVLCHPPAEAEADAEVTQQDAQNVAQPPGRAELPVASLMADKADLGEHHGEEYGHRELPPGVPHQPDRDPPDCQQSQGDGDPPGRFTRPAVHQAGLPHRARQPGVVAPARPSWHLHARVGSGIGSHTDCVPVDKAAGMRTSDNLVMASNLSVTRVLAAVSG
jgi:hypothetical protein